MFPFDTVSSSNLVLGRGRLLKNDRTISGEHAWIAADPSGLGFVVTTFSLQCFDPSFHCVSALYAIELVTSCDSFDCLSQIMDLISTNGTMVNGEMLQPLQARQLVKGK